MLPRISGRGFVVGTRTAAVDPDDPYPLGYALSDLWDMWELKSGGPPRTGQPLMIAHACRHAS